MHKKLLTKNYYILKKVKKNLMKYKYLLEEKAKNLLNIEKFFQISLLNHLFWKMKAL